MHRGFEVRRKLRHAGRVEERARRHVDAKGGPHSTDDLRGRHGIAPELEEVVEDVDAIDAEDRCPD
ncbi:MAG TPA: hypothetical protein VM580_18990, partial [Labilithrix sp.]|nr:hypothetical protein [Labilithrix sp.]